MLVKTFAASRDMITMVKSMGLENYTRLFALGKGEML
jgi:hypothetical protein